MDNRHFNDGNKGPNHRFGGAPAGQSSGQGASLNRGGCKPGNQDFHPGFAPHGAYSGYGGGRYGVHGRPGGRPLVHDLRFAAQRSSGNNRLEAQYDRASGGVEFQG
jgi:hypothetical protein